MRVFGCALGGGALLWLALVSVLTIAPVAPLSPKERGELCAALRDGAHGVRICESCDRRAEAIVLSRFIDGHAVIRREFWNQSLNQAVSQMGADGGAGRWKIDIAWTSAPVVPLPWLRELAFMPGIDGLMVRGQGVLTPDDLMLHDLSAGRRPFGDFDFEFGLDFAAARSLLAKGTMTARRVRTESFIEAEPVPESVWRGRPGRPATPVVRANLLSAARAGGEYLLRHLRADGRFEYEYDTVHDVEARTPYSWTRHAGAAYFLAQLHRVTGELAFAKGARRAIDGLGLYRIAEGTAAVIDSESHLVDLGSNALALAAIAELLRTVPDDVELATRASELARFILSMQRDNGDFHHLYRPGIGPDASLHVLYFSGEAAFALAQFSSVVTDPKLAVETRRSLAAALEYLTVTQYAHFAGQFFFGEDHWTCKAAAIANANSSTARRFCTEFARFLRRAQFAADDAVAAAQPDFAGAYGFSPLYPPHPTPVGSRTEAAIAAYRLAEAPNKDDERAKLIGQIRLGLQFLLDRQLVDDDYLLANPAAARGGFLMSDVRRQVRIDFVQHAGSAMLEALDLF